MKNVVILIGLIQVILSLWGQFPEAPLWLLENRRLSKVQNNAVTDGDLERTRIFLMTASLFDGLFEKFRLANHLNLCFSRTCRLFAPLEKIPHPRKRKNYKVSLVAWPIEEDKPLFQSPDAPLPGVLTPLLVSFRRHCFKQRTEQKQQMLPL